MKKFIGFFILFFHLTHSYAWELEAYAGAQYTNYDDVEEANSSGVAARAKINFYTQNRGMFVNLNGRGISPLTSDFIAGYAWRSSGAWFFEGGVGGSISSIYGKNVAALAGSGYRLSNNLFINFPIILAGSGIYWSPYIGYSF